MPFAWFDPFSYFSISRGQCLTSILFLAAYAKKAREGEEEKLRYLGSWSTSHTPPSNAASSPGKKEETLWPDKPICYQDHFPVSQKTIYYFRVKVQSKYCAFVCIVKLRTTKGGMEKGFLKSESLRRKSHFRATKQKEWIFCSNKKCICNLHPFMTLLP